MCYDEASVMLAGDERQRCWTWIVERHPFFGEQQAKTSRQIPVIALEQRSR